MEYIMQGLQLNKKLVTIIHDSDFDEKGMVKYFNLYIVRDSTVNLEIKIYY